MRKHYKNIQDALIAERPTDKIVKILSNKFAIVKSQFTNGTYYKEPYVMGISNGTTVYSFGLLRNMKAWCKKVELMPNIDCTGFWLVNPQTKKEYYKMSYISNRKYKQNYRKISKLI